MNSSKRIRTSTPNATLEICPLPSWNCIYRHLMYNNLAGCKSSLNLERVLHCVSCRDKNLPHLEPDKTGQPACLVLESPRPFLRRFHQNAAEPCWKKSKHRHEPTVQNTALSRNIIAEIKNNSNRINSNDASEGKEIEKASHAVYL